MIPTETSLSIYPIVSTIPDTSFSSPQFLRLLRHSFNGKIHLKVLQGTIINV